MSFGRKGLGPDEVPAGAIPARRAAPAADHNPQVAAFIAAERSRAAELGIPSTRYHETGGSLPDPSVITGARQPGPRKSMLLAYVLWWFGYAFAAHRFYLGDTTGAVKQAGLFLGGLVVMMIGAGSNTTLVVAIGMIALGAGFLWLLIDMFRIPGMCRRANAWADSPQRYFD